MARPGRATALHNGLVRAGGMGMEWGRRAQEAAPGGGGSRAAGAAGPGVGAPPLGLGFSQTRRGETQAGRRFGLGNPSFYL